MAAQVFAEKCRNYSEKELDKAIAPILEGILPKLGERPKILLKPNLLRPARPEEAVTTHPAFVYSVAKFLRKARPNAQIFIGDSSGCMGLPTTNKALSGYNKAIIRFKLRPIAFEGDKIVKIANPKGTVWKEVPIAKIVTQSDIVINLPKLKTHALTVYTGAVKNMYGCVPGAIKGKGHADAVSPAKFSELAVDVYQIMKNSVHLMDAVIGMEGPGGPSNGTPKQTGYVLGSRDGVALDSVALRLAGIPEKIVLTQAVAKQRGLYPEIKLNKEIKPLNYKYPSPRKWAILTLIPETMLSFLASKFSPIAMNNPIIIRKKCTLCYSCKKVCPVKAISIKSKIPVIDKRKCIHCLCCAEQCPYGAIETKGSFLLRILHMR